MATCNLQGRIASRPDTNIAQNKTATTEGGGEERRGKQNLALLTVWNLQAQAQLAFFAHGDLNLQRAGSRLRLQWKQGCCAMRLKKQSRCRSMHTARGKLKRSGIVVKRCVCVCVCVYVCVCGCQAPRCLIVVTSGATTTLHSLSVD